MAEGIAKKYIEREGLADRIHVVSSGTLVGQDDNLSDDRVRQILEHGVAYGWRGCILDQKRYSGDSAYKTEMRATAQRVLTTTLRPLDATFRELALQQIGIVYPHERKKTQARPDVDVILGVEQNHADAIQDIYRDSGYYPTIDTLAQYAGRPEIIFPDAMGSLKIADYVALRKKFEIVVPLAIQKALNDPQLSSRR